MRVKELKLPLLCVALFAVPALLAQQPSTITVTISVTDPSRASIPHAQVRIVPAFDAAPKMETDDKGRLTLQLRPRDYALVVECQGFKKSVTHFEVRESNQPQTVSVVLQVGGGSHVEVEPAPSKDSLTLRTDQYHISATLSSAELKAMPHVTLTVHNSHTNADETYSGVRLADLLIKMGAPLGSELHGGALASYIVATGSDGYQAVLALGEVDPGFHPGEVLVADAMDGKPLDAHSGPLKLVVSEDKRPARSVRNLTMIEIKAAP